MKKKFIIASAFFFAVLLVFSGIYYIAGRTILTCPDNAGDIRNTEPAVYTIKPGTAAESETLVLRIYEYDENKWTESDTAEADIHGEMKISLQRINSDYYEAVIENTEQSVRHIMEGYELESSVKFLMDEVKLTPDQEYALVSCMESSGADVSDTFAEGWQGFKGDGRGWALIIELKS